LHRSGCQPPLPDLIEVFVPDTLLVLALRQLALAYFLEGEIEAGGVESYSKVAGRLGISRARVSQIADMVLLPSAVQEVTLVAR
jgi:hypothetical protein